MMCQLQNLRAGKIHAIRRGDLRAWVRIVGERRQLHGIHLGSWLRSAIDVTYYRSGVGTAVDTARVDVSTLVEIDDV